VLKDALIAFGVAIIAVGGYEVLEFFGALLAGGGATSFLYLIL
jgi:hypothetical protein